MNLSQITRNKFRDEGERIVLYFKDKTFTNYEMLRNFNKLAGALKELGVGKGDRVIVQMPNCPEVIDCFNACWQIGAVIVPVNYLMNEEEIAYIYQDSGARVVVSSTAYLPVVRAAGSRAPAVEHIIMTGSDLPADVLSFNELRDNAREEHEYEDMGEDDLAALIYTAGTTGKSKGVMHTHHSLYANAEMQFRTIKLPEPIVSLSVLPLCHSFGIATMNNRLFRAATGVLVDTFDLDVILSSIEKYKIQSMAGVPTMYVYLLMHPNPHKYDLSSMRYWLSGAAPLAMETWTRFKEVYGGEIIEGWGLTEAGANNATNPFEGTKKVGSIGLPMKGTEMAIMDDKGNILPRGEMGEIVIRGPQIMKGYWNKPEETRQVLYDGWLHTGDVGYEDEDSYFWITDRKKDIIIKGGENISPRIIEEVLFSHPAVSEAAVIGVHDETYGENIRAFVVLNPGERTTAEEIIQFCQEELTGFLAPRDVVFLEALPKNLVGKVLKKELRKLA